jgi:hypothetical protein
VERLVRLLIMAAAGFVPAGALWAASAAGHGRIWMVFTGALAAAALIAGWPDLARLPDPHSASLTLRFTALATIALAAWRPGPTAVLVAIALGFPAVFARELTRPAPRPELVRSVTGTTAGVIAVAAIGLWVSAERFDQFLDLAVLAGSGIAAAALGLGLSLLAPPGRWRAEIGALASLAAAAGAGAGMSFAVVTHWWAGAAVAAACAVAPGAIWLVGESRPVLTQPWRWGDAALVCLPLAVAAVPVWTAALIR